LAATTWRTGATSGSRAPRNSCAGRGRASVSERQESITNVKIGLLVWFDGGFGIADVYLAFHRHPPQQLRERLTRALSGPALPEAETTISRDGRNVMFELALGAEWALCGADVELLEPDLLLKMPSRGYFTACKRPEHEHGIRAAVRSAASQLRSALASAPDDTFGIVAVCISRVLNPGNAYFSGSYRQLSELVNMLMDRHRKDWRTTDFHPRNMAVLFYAHTPADWGNGLFRLSAVRIGPTRRGESVHQNLRDDMTRLYSNSR
jgi:hypothetical protein